MHSWFGGRTIRAKVSMAFAVVCVMTVALGLFALQRIETINESLTVISAQALPSVKALSRISVLAERFRAAVALRVMSYDDASRADMDKLVAGAAADTRKALDAYAPLIDNDEKRRLQNDVEARWTALVKDSETILSMTRSRDPNGAQVLLFTSFRQKIVDFRNVLAADIEFSDKAADTAAASAAATYASARAWVIALLGAASVICALAGTGLVLGVVRPLSAITELMHRLAGQDREVVILGTDRRDEIGAMAAALQVFKDGMIRADALAAAQAAEQAVKEKQAARLADLVHVFEDRVGDTVAVLSAAAAELQGTARTLTSSASQTNRQAASVASAAEEASSGVSTLAAAAEALTSAIGDITRQVAQSARTAEKAVADAQRTNGIVEALAAGAQRIGMVVDMIASIAGQTNLLALNATIEAARAGNAGKGFAVVASEVKSLANQTAKATGEISAQIAEIRGFTNAAVEAIRDIVATIQDLGSVATAVAAAVEQQGGATAEIAKTTQHTAVSTQDVAVTIAGVTEAATTTESAAGHVLKSADGLARQADLLRREVDTFVAGVRAA